jgi:hypothetical protein
MGFIFQPILQERDRTQKANELKRDWIIKYDDGSVKTPSKSPLLAEELAFASESNFAEFGIVEVSISRGAVNEAGLPQIGLAPDSIVKIAANEGTSYDIVNPSKVGTTKVNIFPSNNVPDSISKISFSQNSTTKVNTERGTLQINTTEVNASHQTFTRITDINLSKISLPSRISPQQFLNSNSLFFDLHFLISLHDNNYSFKGVITSGNQINLSQERAIANLSNSRLYIF